MRQKKTLAGGAVRRIVQVRCGGRRCRHVRHRQPVRLASRALRGVAQSLEIPSLTNVSVVDTVS